MNQEEKKTKLFRRDFTMVVIGQVISLFGNAILRFALPLYLLQVTESASLFGIVTACSFCRSSYYLCLAEYWRTG